MAKLADGGPVYEAAERWIEAALRGNDSLFTPGRAIWADGPVEDFYDRFIRHPDESSDPFEVKLKRQLDGAPSETVQLAGETLFLHFLIALNITGRRKREVIENVLSWTPEPVSVPDELARSLDRGLASVGVAFNTFRPFQLYFLLDFMRSWKKLSPAEQEKRLSDPWAFKGLATKVPLKAAYMQREALLHLVHPETFECIISREAKSRIAQYFADLVTEPTQDVDRQLLQIRRRLSEKYGPGMTFYDPPIEGQWRADPSKWGQFIEWARTFYARPDFDEQERDYKLEIASHLEAARSAVEEGADDWLVKLRRAFGKPNNLTAWQSHSTFLDWCEKEREAARAALQALWAPGRKAEERIRGFLKALPSEAVAGPGSRTSLASFLHMVVDPTAYPFYRVTLFQKAFELTGYPPPRKEADEARTYEHALEFLDRLSEEASGRGLELRDRLDAQGVLWAVLAAKEAPRWMPKKDRLAFCDYLELECPDIEGPSDSPLGELESELFLEPAGYLARVDRLLRAKRQLIFHGPPGTGKTYVAQQLARFYAQDGGRHEIVQFHPSYAYEDFIEGYRPTLLEGQPGFKPKDGPLKRIARAAAAEPGAKFVLLIDEINRGNLAKVFGELYFLLEYRDAEIVLQYTEEPFSLPKNLWIIGTMNTADRSIALVDSALRRRFHFIPFFPDEPPIEGLLRRWLQANKPALEWVADVVDLANQRLGDRHTAIGPSYFLRKDLDEEWIRLIWEHSVLPYLQEQFFGQEDRLREFELGALRAKLTNSTSAADSEEDD